MHPTVLRVLGASVIALAATLVATDAASHGLEHAVTAPAPAAMREHVHGTVHELVIEDRVAAMTVRHFSLRTPAGDAMALVGEAVATLRDGAAVDVVGRRNGNVLFVQSMQPAGRAVDKRAAATQAVTGKLVLAHSDDFETGKSEYLYEVHADDGTRTRLKLEARPDALQAGMRVSAYGSQVAATGELDPARIEILALPAAEKMLQEPGVVAKAATTHTVLVIPMKFTNTTSDPMTIAAIQNVMTTSSGSVANFYAEASYGQHLLNVTVPPAWLQSTTLASPSTCNYTAIGNAADAAATAAGYNLAAYDFRVYMFPRVTACGWSGLAYIGYPHEAWINGPSSVVTSVIGHEMGHNFGLLHAASVKCGAVPIGGGSCTASEYGDPWNTMGNQRAMHFDSTQKSLLGWIAPSTVTTHGSGNGVYVLSPIETGGASSYAIKIPAASNRTYWLEYRQPIGFDAPLSSYPNNGAQIRVASPFETLCSGCGTYSDDTEILDFVPSTATLTDGTLVVGQSFTDTDYGFTVNVIAATPTALTVQISGPNLSGSSTNVALAANGGVASASSTYGVGYPASAINNGDRAGINPGSGGYWNDATQNAWPDWVQVDFSGSKTIDRVVVYSVQDNYTSPVDPSDTMTFTLRGLTNFTVQGWNGSAWVTLGTVTNNNLVKRTVTFSPFTTNRIRVNVNAAGGTWSRVAEVEAWTTATSNVAAASAGGVATASSTYGPGYPASAINNGERAGLGPGSGGYWNDATQNSWPDWVQIVFSGTKTLDRVVVYSVQDNYASPVDPSDTMTFSLRGVTDFTVQGWNGSAWVTLGTVTGNNLVKRTVTFTPFATDRVRVNVNAAGGTWSRITEVEAWGY